MFRITCALLAVALGVAAPAAANPQDSKSEETSVQGSVQRAVSRLAAERHATVPGQTPPRRSWAHRHPIATAAIVGGGTGFLIGYLPGDDGVFYDFTAGFNGMVVGGIGAGAGASLVAIVRALRR